ncbi:MAG: HAD family hydrolase [Cyanobacteria bacterium HKST-UBA02]|nr:HAD family hydrolase [Cyanobacteria bacterium HKST-UBA02]
MDRPLLILDIDETLLHATEEPLARDCDFRAGQFFVYLRPGSRKFLESIVEAYDYAVWSSATRDYLDIVVERLTADLTEQPSFVWDRSRCTRRVDFHLQEEYFLKNLTKLERRGIDLNRVLILEDEPRKVHRNYGNAIYVRPYLGAKEDDELLLLDNYLTSIKDVPNYRAIDKRSWRSL